MLELIIAPSGLGKTTHILENIKEERNKSKIIIITPDQNSYNFEKILCEELGGTFNIDVVNLSRLYKNLTTMLGLDINQIKESDKYFYYLELLDRFKERDNFLIKRLTQDIEFINIINDLIEELDEYGVTCEKLTDFSENNDSNKEKFNDIVDVYTEYKNILLENNEYTKLGYIENIIQNMKNVDLSNYVFYIDGYYNFSPVEYKIIELLIEKAKKVSISIISEVDRYTNFKLEHLIKKEINTSKKYKFLNLEHIREYKEYALDVYRKSHEIVAYINEIIRNNLNKFSIVTLHSSNQNENYKVFLEVMGDNVELVKMSTFRKTRFENEEVYFLQKEFTKVSKSYKKTGRNHIAIYEAPDYESEVKQLARNISKELVENNYKLNDIAILYRDDIYEKYMYILKEFGINFHIDKNMDVSNHRLVKLLKNILNYSDEKFKYSILNILKSETVSLKTETKISDIEKILDYKLVTSIGDLENEYFEFPIGEFNRDKLAEVKKDLHTLAEELGKLKKKNNLTNYLKQLLKILRVLGVEEKISVQNNTKHTLNELEENTINRQIFEKIINLIEELEKHGDKKISFISFKKIFNILLDKIIYRSIPLSEEYIIMSKIDLSKVENKKIVFVLGLNNEVLPKSVISEGIIDDEDKYALSLFGIELSPRSKSLMTDEDFVAYIALTRAKEKLYLSYSSSNSKYQIQKSSVYIDTVRKIFSSPEEEDIIKKVNTEVIFEVNLLKEYDIFKKDFTFYSELELMYFYKKLKYSMNLDIVDKEYLLFLKETYDKILYSKRKEYAASDILEKLQLTESKEEIYSFSKLRRYEENPLIYFVENVLNIRLEQDYGISPLLIGSYKHALLEDKVLTNFINEKTREYSDYEYDSADSYVESLNIEIKEILKQVISKSTNKDVQKLSLIAKSQKINSYSMDVILDGMVRTVGIEIYYQIISGYRISKKEERFTLECKANVISMTLKNGKKVEKKLGKVYNIKPFKLNGIIDRIDKNVGSYFIVDYKSSKTDFETDKFYGQRISQLLLYMLAVILAEEIQVGKIKGIFYRELAKKNKESKEYRLRGLVNESLLKEFNMVSEFMFMRTKKDGSPYVTDQHKVYNDLEFNKLIEINIEYLYRLVEKIQSAEFRLDSINQENEYLFNYAIGEDVILEKEYEKIQPKDFKKLIFV